MGGWNEMRGHGIGLHRGGVSGFPRFFLHRRTNQRPGDFAGPVQDGIGKTARSWRRQARQRLNVPKGIRLRPLNGGLLGTDAPWASQRKKKNVMVTKTMNGRKVTESL